MRLIFLDGLICLALFTADTGAPRAIRGVDIRVDDLMFFLSLFQHQGF